MKRETEETIFNGLIQGRVDVELLVWWLKGESRHIAQQLKQRKIDYLELATDLVLVSSSPSAQELTFIPGKTLRQILKLTLLRMKTEQRRARKRARKVELNDEFIQSVTVIEDALTSAEVVCAKDRINSHRSTVAEFAALVGKRKSTVRAWMKQQTIPSSEGSIPTAAGLKALGLLSTLVSGLVDPKQS